MYIPRQKPCNISVLFCDFRVYVPKSRNYSGNAVISWKYAWKFEAKLLIVDAYSKIPKLYVMEDITTDKVEN